MSASMSVTTSQALADPARPFFDELDPTGELQALRGRQTLICDYATMCLIRMGELYKIHEEQAAVRYADALTHPKLFSPEETNVWKIEKQKREKVVAHFERRIKPLLDARKDAMEEVCTTKQMMDFIKRCKIPLGRNVKNFIDIRPTPILSKLIPNLHHVLETEKSFKLETPAREIIFPLINILYTKNETAIPDNIDPEEAEFGLSSDNVGSDSYITVVNFSGGVKENSKEPPPKKIVSLLLTQDPSFFTSMTSFFATMQFALCLEARVSVMTTINTTLNSSKNTFPNDLVRVIMSYVAPPKSAMEIVEVD